MKRSSTKLVKLFGLSVGVGAGIILVALLVATLFYPVEYIRRIIVWQESDVNDYLYNFPQHHLVPASTPFTFKQAPDEARVAGHFEAVLGADDFDAFLAETGTQAFIVIQDDAVLYENYFNGTQRDSMVTSFSVAKSFTTALIGIALAEGHINSIEDPITDYLPELAERDPRFNEITIRHLLMMAAGLDFQDFRPGLLNSDDILTTYYPDQRQASLEFTHIADLPGQSFQYNKYYPQLLGLILERTTGVAVADYMQQKLWEPLGMEFGGSWSLDSEKSGFAKMEAGVNGRAIDFAKFGRLYLKNGNWDGVQVIPAEWVADSIQVDPSTQVDSYYPDSFGQSLFKDLRGYYKYMWYGFTRGEDGYDFAARGDHGQFIYVAPHKNLIIIRNGAAWGFSGGDTAAGTEWIRAFYQFATDL